METRYSNCMQKLTERLRAFTEARNWDQFHSPKNLAMALSGEVGELNEIFQWLTEEQSREIKKNEVKYKHVQQEAADILLYLLQFCDQLDIDLLKAAEAKIDLNEQKYPVEKAKGNALKYNEH